MVDKSEITRIKLNLWEEVTGKFLKSRKSDQYFQVYIKTYTSILLVEFPNHTKEAKLLEKSLRTIDENERIGIIFTDIPNEPVKVRIIDESRDDKKPSSHLKNGGRP